MSVKAPRGLTHAKKLYSPEVWVERIAASWHEYDRRAVLLVQLPPTMERDDARLGWFLDQLPWWVRVAVELRHPSWQDEEVFGLLERHGASYCVMSGADCPASCGRPRRSCTCGCTGRPTTGCTAARTPTTSCRGGPTGFASGRSGREVYAYFNNDGNGNAVRNARRLRELLRGW